MTPFATFDEHVRAHAREYVDELMGLIRLLTVGTIQRYLELKRQSL